jgi:hypothetical protein
MASREDPITVNVKNSLPNESSDKNINLFEVM